MSDCIQSTVKQLEEANKNKTKKEQHEAVLSSLAKYIETITLRHRIIGAALETEVLAKLYKKQANVMGFEEFHMHLRYVQFDFAKYKENAGALPGSLNELGTENVQLDRYVPAHLCLAVQEIEEAQIGRLTFKSKEAVQQVCGELIICFTLKWFDQFCLCFFLHSFWNQAEWKTCSWY